MPHVKSLTPLQATAAALVIAASGPAHAQLGATVAIAATSISSSSNTADATTPVVHQAANSAARWQESTDANQIRVRQYVSSSGQVYAVSWDGPTMPDVIGTARHLVRSVQARSERGATQRERAALIAGEQQ
jgi:hypothetical protein